MVLISLSTFFLDSVPVVEVTLGSESVSWEERLEVTVVSSDRAESGLGEQVVELASPFSTALTWFWAEGTMVLVDTVLVEVVVNTVGLAEEAVRPVDFSVGVTVAEGLVKAAGLLSLSTSGLMGKVTAETDVPALLGSGRGRVEGSSALEDWTGEGKNCLLAGLGDRLEFCLTGLGLTGDIEGRGIVGISLGRDLSREGVVCTDSDSGAGPELFSEEGDGEADSGLPEVSLAGAGTAELSERPGVLGVLGVLGVRPP